MITGTPPNKYTATFEKPATVTLTGSGIVFTRNLEGVTEKDKNQQITQTWTGKIERNKEGNIAIYGLWSGAYDYLPKEIGGLNHDFMMVKH